MRVDSTVEIEGALRVWWIPQVPMPPFHVRTDDVTAAILLLRTLAAYDLFQLRNRIKPDYCNVGGLEVFEDGEWCEWSDPATGESINDRLRAFEE